MSIEGQADIFESATSDYDTEFQAAYKDMVAAGKLYDSLLDERGTRLRPGCVEAWEAYRAACRRIQEIPNPPVSVVNLAHSIRKTHDGQGTTCRKEIK